MQQIPLHNTDEVAWVDDEDFDKLSKYKWYLSYYGYAVRYESSKKNVVFMHSDIITIPPGYEADHRDRIKLNNLRGNLRVVDFGTNTQNARKRQDNTSGFRGVSHKRDKWCAYINRHGKRCNLGVFKLPEDAARAYDKAALEIYGPEAQTNEKLGLYEG